MVRSLTTSLAEERIKVVGTSNGGEAIALLKQHRFDIAVVDSLVKEAELACRCIRDCWHIPVVLMGSLRLADWERLQSLGVDGYISEPAGAAEVAARLRSVMRGRKQAPQEPGTEDGKHGT